MIWTLIAFGVDAAASCASSRSRAIQRGARQAPAGDRGVDRRRRAHARGGRRSCWPSTASACKEAREQAEEIVARARKAGEVAERESPSRRARSARSCMEQTRRDIEAETRRAIQEIRSEVADLTVLATEKVTRKTLDDDDQRRLVEEALRELDFSALAGGERSRTRMEEIAQVYARVALRGRQGARQARRRPRAARAVRRRARREPRAASSSSRPTSPREEKKDGPGQARRRRRPERPSTSSSC